MPFGSAGFWMDCGDCGLLLFGSTSQHLSRLWHEHLSECRGSAFAPCDLGSCAAEDGHDGTCAQVSGWSS